MGARPWLSFLTSPPGQGRRPVSLISRRGIASKLSSRGILRKQISPRARLSQEIAAKPLTSALDDAVADHPDAPYFRYFGARFAYRDVGAMVNEVAAGMQDSASAPG